MSKKYSPSLSKKIKTEIRSNQAKSSPSVEASPTDDLMKPIKQGSLHNFVATFSDDHLVPTHKRPSKRRNNEVNDTQTVPRHKRPSRRNLKATVPNNQSRPFLSHSIIDVQKSSNHSFSHDFLSLIVNWGFPKEVFIAKAISRPSFKNAEEYRNTFFPLFLLELRAQMHNAFEEGGDQIPGNCLNLRCHGQKGVLTTPSGFHLRRDEAQTHQTKTNTLCLLRPCRKNEAVVLRACCEDKPSVAAVASHQTRFRKDEPLKNESVVLCGSKQCHRAGKCSFSPPQTAENLKKLWSSPPLHISGVLTYTFGPSGRGIGILVQEREWTRVEKILKGVCNRVAPSIWETLGVDKERDEGLCGDWAIRTGLHLSTCEREFVALMSAARTPIFPALLDPISRQESDVSVEGPTVIIPTAQSPLVAPVPDRNGNLRTGLGERFEHWLRSKYNAAQIGAVAGVVCSSRNAQPDLGYDGIFAGEAEKRLGKEVTLVQGPPGSGVSLLFFLSSVVSALPPLNTGLLCNSSFIFSCVCVLCGRQDTDAGGGAERAAYA